jgi:hypothetical protein
LQVFQLPGTAEQDKLLSQLDQLFLVKLQFDLRVFQLPGTAKQDQLLSQLDQLLLVKLQYDLQVFQLPGTAEQDQLLSQLDQLFHPHYFLPLEIKLDLARKLGRDEGKLKLLFIIQFIQQAVPIQLLKR